MAVSDPPGTTHHPGYCLVKYVGATVEANQCTNKNRDVKRCLYPARAAAMDGDWYIVHGTRERN